MSSISCWRISVHADAREVVDRGAESDHLDDRRRARFELPRDLLRHPAVEADVEDHLAAAEERRHLLEQLFARPQRADAGRAAHLVTGEAEEVAAELGDVGGHVRHELRGVDQAQRAGVVRGIGQLADRRERSEHVRHRGERQQLRPVEQLIEVRQIERVVVGHAEVAKLDAAFFLQHQPRHEVGVVLHLGEHDGVAFVEVGASPRVGDEVDGLGDVLREHQAAR